MKKSLLFYIIVTLLIGGLPSIFVYMNDTYNSLNKPILAPPGIIFPIVWTILFILMAISIYRVNKVTDYNCIYFLQLIINALWTPIFFGLKHYLFAFIWLIILLIVVLIMVSGFYKVDKKSAYLNIPYIIWLLFAGYLNFSIYLLN